MRSMKEKIQMYKRKESFIKNLSSVFETTETGTTVTSIEYEVYSKQIREDYTHFVEYITVNFNGGAKAVRTATGNSNTSNFRAVGELLEGGCYSDYQFYTEITSKGFELVTLEDKED